MLLKNELTELSFTSFLNGYFSTVRVVKLVYSPQWFFGKDILIDIVSIFVLLLIAFFSIKYYNIKKNRNYIYLTLSFVILAASFLAKILINFNVYYKVIETQDLGVISAVYQSMKATHSIFITSLVVYWLSTLFGYYILYSIYQNQSLSNFFFKSSANSPSFSIVMSLVFSPSFSKNLKLKAKSSRVSSPCPGPISTIVSSLSISR